MALTFSRSGRLKSGRWRMWLCSTTSQSLSATSSVARQERSRCTFPPHNLKSVRRAGPTPRNVQWGTRRSIQDALHAHLPCNALFSHRTSHAGRSRRSRIAMAFMPRACQALMSRTSITRVSRRSIACEHVDDKCRAQEPHVCRACSSHV